MTLCRLAVHEVEGHLLTSHSACGSGQQKSNKTILMSVALYGVFVLELFLRCGSTKKDEMLENLHFMANMNIHVQCNLHFA